MQKPLRALIDNLPALSAVVGGSYLLLRGLSIGPVMHSDSYEYLDAATLVAQGKAWSSLDDSLVFFPPLYPAMLAIVTLAGVPVESAAVVVSALVFGLNIFLAGHTVRRIGGTATAAAVASLIVMVSARSRLDHAEALSDPLFTLLCQVSLLGLLAFEASASTKAMSVAAAGAGLSMFTRFLGAATIISAAATLVMSACRRPGTGPARLRSAVLGVLACGVAAVPCLVWIGRNLSLHGIWAGGRELPVGDVSAQAGVLSLLGDFGRYWWLSVNPSPWNRVTGVVVLLLLFATALALRRRGFARAWPHGVFVFVYSASLLASAIVLNPQWRSEYALPLFVAVNTLVVTGVSQWFGPTAAGRPATKAGQSVRVIF